MQYNPLELMPGAFIYYVQPDDLHCYAHVDEMIGTDTALITFYSKMAKTGEAGLILIDTNLIRITPTTFEAARILAWPTLSFALDGTMPMFA